MTDAYREGYAKINWTPLPPVPRKRPVAPARSDLATPMFTRDFSEPVQSMADGKYYGSKAALARSHRADHNPHGQDFIELGNEPVPEFREYVPDAKKSRETVARAIHDFDNGWRPDVVALDE